MSEKDNGGPAFPVVPTMEGAGQWGYAYPGMTLRDWFAGQALAGLCAEYSRMTGSYEECTHGVACAALGIADAMLAERAKE